jgi:hypothetical protein
MRADVLAIEAISFAQFGLEYVQGPLIDAYVMKYNVKPCI